MTIEQLKAALDAAVEASKAAPTDDALKAKAVEAETAYNEAVAAGQQAGGKQGGDSLDETKLDDATKTYLKKLRDENASHRVKNRELKSAIQAAEEQKKKILEAAGIQMDEQDPAKLLEASVNETQTLALRNAVLESAVQYGIPSDQLDFYEFLIMKEAQGLEEGDEISEEQMTAIVGKVKGRSQSATTTVGTGVQGGGTPPPPGSHGAITLDDFCKMNITQKSDLYLKQPSLYAQLLSEAKAKKKLI